MPMTSGGTPPEAVSGPGMMDVGIAPDGDGWAVSVQFANPDWWMHLKPWEARHQAAELEDNRHHAPLCPSNHYHGMRNTIGNCNCGAERVETEQEETKQGS